MEKPYYLKFRTFVLKVLKVRKYLVNNNKSLKPIGMPELIAIDNLNRELYGYDSDKYAKYLFNKYRSLLEYLIPGKDSKSYNALSRELESLELGK